MDQGTLLTIYRAMVTARQIDQVEQELTSQGEAFFHLSGAGHEATAALATYLTPDDWLHCHYRDRALLLARGISVQAFFDQLLCKDASSSRGRRMNTFFSDPRLKILSMVTPTGNNALQAAGVAAAVKDEPTRPIVYCGNGDGTTQQGEFLEAVAEAARNELPVLFVVQDNHYAISTPTSGRTFYESASAEESFAGIPIHRVDGRHVPGVCDAFGPIIAQMRADRRPQLVILDVERLASHTNADDHRIYRSADDIARCARTGDPIERLAEHLLATGVETSELERISHEVHEQVRSASIASKQSADPQPQLIAKRPIHVELTHPSYEVRGSDDDQSVTMGVAIREVLRHRLDSDPAVFLYGEDIEDPKGDVFGITKGLSTEFTDRVCNSPLSESTIVGTCIGRALVGQHPVAFMQFADFLPLANNQIVSELATMFWRTDGQWHAPVVLMVPCGAYRPGLGPYHAQTLEATLAQVPGLDVFMPSTATDAAGLLNAAFASKRPTVFLYPKAMLNDAARGTSDDVQRHFVPIGTARKARTGRDLTFVAWGNTVPLCERASSVLEGVGIETEIVDLRCQSPWDERMVLASAEKTARVIVVHEDNHTCGLGGEVLATLAEKAPVPVAMRRVARADTYIPCNFQNQMEVLPSYKRVLETAAELLDFDLTWEEPTRSDDDCAFDLPAIGSSPSDETVTLVEFLVRPGDRVKPGDEVAVVEAAKSVFEITSPVDGEVEAFKIDAGDDVSVGDPIMRIHLDAPVTHTRTAIQEDPGRPILVRRRPEERLVLPRRDIDRRAFDVGMSAVAAITGSRVMSNRELLDGHGQMSNDDVVRLTGIESRNWVAGEETAVSLAVRACEKRLEQDNLAVDELDLVICSTTSPTSVTPSMACRVLAGLVGDHSNTTLQAFDINAACSGYLYALQAGYDFLQSQPEGRVLLVTTEVLSPLLDRDDLDTAILFGDAASATVLYGEAHFDRAHCRLVRPELSAKGEDGSSLSVPFRDSGFIQMQGRKVFTEAVRSMVSSLNRVCQRAGVGVDELELIVPHQANQRIIDAIQHRVHVDVYSNIRRFGNTSSTSIPLCLSEVLPSSHHGDRLGLCAFGGGFTFGAGILETL